MIDNFSHEIIIRHLFKFRENIKKKINKNIKGYPLYLVRVDDFPRWNVSTDKFIKFHNILNKHDIPYLLGVTPFLSANPLDPDKEKLEYLTSDEIEILKMLKNENCDFALHGITHKTVSKKLHTETIGIKKIEIEENLKMALDVLTKDGIEPKFVIPPFNTFDLNSLNIFKKYFIGVCGGPETISTLGFRISPTYFDGIYYIPSYIPLYDKVKNIIPFLKKICNDYNDNIIIPITIHWSWETGDNLNYVEKLCKFIKDKTQPWNLIFKK
jgi:hypothetical protein